MFFHTLKSQLNSEFYPSQRSYTENANTYASLLQDSINNRSLTQGKLLHAHFLVTGLNQNAFYAFKLATMYAICGSMAEARRVFDLISEPSIYLWNMMIRGYACNNPCE